MSTNPMRMSNNCFFKYYLFINILKYIFYFLKNIFNIKIILNFKILKNKNYTAQPYVHPVENRKGKHGAC